MIYPDPSGTDPGKDNATVLGIISAERIGNWNNYWNISSHRKRTTVQQVYEKGAVHL